VYCDEHNKEHCLFVDAHVGQTSISDEERQALGHESLQDNDCITTRVQVHACWLLSKSMCVHAQTHKEATVRAQDTQGSNCTSTRHTRKQLYEHKTHKEATVRAHDTQGSNCTSTRHTRKQLYEHKTHKVGQTQARQMADNTVKAFCVVAANQCGPVPHRKKMYY